MGSIKRHELKEFISKIPGFLTKDLEEQLVAFGYFVQEVVGDPIVDASDLTQCYRELDIPQPKEIDEFLQILSTRNVLVDRGHRTYRISAIAAEDLEKKYEIVQPDKKQVYVKPSKPPKNINEELSKFLILHRKITEVSKDLFFNGHFPQAIFEAVKSLEQEIKNKSEIHDKIGVNLINHVFSENNPILKVVDGNNSEHVDEREGFRYILIGVFRGIKNPQSHSIQELNDPTKALEYLALMSILLKRVQDSKKS